MSHSDIVLHIWPSKWDLPSFDPLCLATVMYLQQVMPGKFRIAECNNPDLSPTGQLPFLTHEQHTVSSFGAIVKYIAELKIATDVESLGRTERAKITAWSAHVESHLGDIVYYALYSHLDNWTELTHPALVSMFPVPQRYYVPGRIRESYRPRLEVSGMWGLQAAEKNKNKPFKKIDKDREKAEQNLKFYETFGKEKILDKARTLFDIYARLLGEKDFLHSNRPTTLDALLAAHMLVLLNPTYPEPCLQTLLTTSYPALSSHAHRVYGGIFGPSHAALQTASAQRLHWRSLIPWPSADRKTGPGKKGGKELEEEMHDTRMRWGFFGLALGSLAVYLFVAFKQAVVIQKRSGVTEGELLENEEEDEEDEDEDEEE